MGKLDDLIRADLDKVFFNTNDYGTAGVWQAATPAGGAAPDPVTVNGLFHNTYKGIQSDGFEFETADPNFLVSTANITTMQHGDGWVIEGRSFVVTGIQPDAHGYMTRIILREA